VALFYTYPESIPYQVTGLNEVNRCAVLQAWNQKYADLIVSEELTVGEGCLMTREEVSEDSEERNLPAPYFTPAGGLLAISTQGFESRSLSARDRMITTS